MSLFGFKEKKEIERLKSQLSPEQIESADLQGKIEQQQGELEKVSKKVQEKEKQLEELKAQLVETDERILLQSFGVYTPRYSLMNSDEYRERLTDVRTKQKDMIKAKTAVTGNPNWTVNGSASQGRKMVADMQKLLLRAFNSECDDTIEHVKYSNIDSSEKRISSSRDAISKLGAIMGVSISQRYFNLKIDELYLAFEYAQKKQEEKEAQKEARERMREAAKLAKEIEEARKKLEKEQRHYQNALKAVDDQLKNASEADRPAIEEKRKELVSQLEKIDKEFKDVDYREANQRAGYVYVISNIGAFGENVYKIGMTRRLNPMDRVDELGDASVPFNFDVHAMIFSDDAPRLEAALHNAFADRKLNFVNQRREFFRVSLDEIKKVVKENYDQSVEFIDLAPAEQYRESLVLLKQAKEQ
jgi:predicted  nucleic acid-binding Zn-ribbon protein